jgi:ribonuclease D
MEGVTSSGPDLELLAERAVAAGRLAVDTEFVSNGRYLSLLCLVQVAVDDPGEPEGVVTEIVDPLEAIDPAPLARVLADPGITVYVHAGRQDIALLRRTWETEVRNVFDTQIAGGFVGLGAGQAYDKLVKRVLDVQLSGSEAFTQWDRRPLTDSQLAYARDDARWLLLLGEALERRLEEAGRLDWAREESRPLEQESDVRDPDRIFARLPRVSRLGGEQRGAARELVAWREGVAQRLERPAGWVLADHVLVELARRRPTTLEELERVRGLGAQTARRRGAELLEAVARGRRLDPPSRPDGGRPPDDPQAAPLVALGDALVRHRAREAQVAAQLVTTQAELAEVVAARGNGRQPPVRVLSGWRRDLVGAELLDLLAGRRALAVGSDGRLEVRPTAEG